MTTNAYAQNNTERLIHIIETTDSTETTLDSLQTLLTSIGNDIMEALSALAGDIDMISDDMTTEFGDVDTAISNVDAKVSALDSKIMMLDSAIMDIDTDVSALGEQITTLDQQIQQVDTTYKDAADNIEVSLTAIKDTVDELTECEICDAVEAMSVSITANAARINELTTSLTTISEQLGTIQDELDIVSTTTATAATAQARAPLTGPVMGDATLEITPYDIARNVKGEGTSAEAKVTYTFTCEEDVFITKVDGTGRTTATGLAVFNANAKVTVGVSGPVTDELYETDFEGLGTLDRAITRDNAPLLANNTLTITLTADDTALGNTIPFTPGTIYGPGSKDGDKYTAGKEVNNIKKLAANLTSVYSVNNDKADNEQNDDNKVTAQTLGPTIYELEISWISDYKDPMCTFMRTDATTDTKTAYVSLSYDSDSEGVLHEDMKTLDCNGVDTTIVSINPIMTGDLKQAVTLKFTVDNDDKAIFSFDSNGTHSLAKGYEDALPLDLGEDNLEISATISQLTTLLLLVDYQSVDGNECNVPDN